jgi:RNA polymerase sigma factor (sigma-70 family)
MTPNEIILDNISTVEKVIKRHYNEISQHITIEEARSAGYFALVRTVKNFDPTKVKNDPRAYFYTTILREIRKSYYQDNTIVWGRDVGEMVSSVYKTFASMRNHNEDITDKDLVLTRLSERTHMDRVKLSRFRRLWELMHFSTLRLDADTDDRYMPPGNSVELKVDSKTAEEMFLAIAEKKCLLKALKKLSKYNKRIIQWRFFEGLTLQQCGDRLGVSRERARQIEAGALQILKKLLERNE